MSEFANIVTQFTAGDLQIFSLQFRISQCPFFSLAASPLHALADSLFKLSETLCGFPSKLPPCDIAFLLSRPLNEVDIKFTVTAIAMTRMS